MDADLGMTFVMGDCGNGGHAYSQPPVPDDPPCIFCRVRYSVNREESIRRAALRSGVARAKEGR